MAIPYHTVNLGTEKRGCSVAGCGWIEYHDAKGRLHYGTYVRGRYYCRAHGDEVDKMVEFIEGRRSKSLARPNLDK